MLRERGSWRGGWELVFIDSKVDGLWELHNMEKELKHEENGVQGGTFNSLATKKENTGSRTGARTEKL